MTELYFHFSLLCIGEGNGNALQCSCLENPRDRGAWWAAIYGVAQSRTWLKWLSSSSSSIVSVVYLLILVTTLVIGRTVAETEAPILWPPDAKSKLIGKDPDAGKDWRQEEKGRTENEMVRWYHWPMDMSLSKLLELVMDREAWHAAGHEVIKDRTWLSDWTELNWPWGLITFCKGHLYWYYDHFILKHLIIFVHFYLFSW